MLKKYSKIIKYLTFLFYRHQLGSVLYLLVVAPLLCFKSCN